jgi:hypothetical protein
MFLLSGGNLKEIAEHVGVSYPTIRSRLDKVIENLRRRNRQDQNRQRECARRRRFDASRDAAKRRGRPAHQGDLIMRYVIALLALTSVAFAQSAEEPATASKWAKTIEDYGKELSAMSPQQYRDKKDFEWIPRRVRKRRRSEV